MFRRGPNLIPPASGRLPRELCQPVLEGCRYQNRSEIVIFPGIPRLPNRDPPRVANASPVPYAACEGRSVQYCTMIQLERNRGFGEFNE